LKRDEEKYHYTNTTALSQLSALTALSALRNLRSGTSPPQIMTSSMTPPSAHPLVFAEEAPPKTETTSSEDLLRKMIVEKISGAEVVVVSMESSIAEKERLIAENRATLAGSREEIQNLRKQLAILDSMSGGVPPTNVCEGVTRGWTIIEGASAFAGKDDELVCKSEEEAKKRVLSAQFGGFEHSHLRFWPRKCTADEMIRNIEVADGTTSHAKSRVFVAPGATIKLLREKEEEGYMVYCEAPGPGTICDSGVCTGMTWDEAKMKITETEGHKYWQEWVYRVNWNEAKCQEGICTGMTWAEAKMKITEKAGHKYWQEWVHRVNWASGQE
jgi:hypothetical protein